jgi:hypothetical protein
MNATQLKLLPAGGLHPDMFYVARDGFRIGTVALSPWHNRWYAYQRDGACDYDTTYATADEAAAAVAENA